MPNKTKKGKKQNECGKQAGGHSIQYYLRSDSSRTRNSSSNMTETGDKTSTPPEHGHLVNQDDSKIQFGEVISNFQSSIKKVISEFKSMMIEEMDGIKDELQSNIVKLADLKESLEFSQTQIDNQKQKMIELQSEKTRLEKEVQELRSLDLQRCDEILRLEQKLYQKILDLERYSRTYNIRIIGIPEENNENCMDLVAQTIFDNKLIPGKSIDQITDLVENAHRTGKKTSTGSRQIIAKILRRPARNMIVRAAKSKLNRKSGAVIKIFEDLIKEDFVKKKAAQDQLKEAYANNQKGRFYRGELIIDGKTVPIKGL